MQAPESIPLETRALVIFKHPPGFLTSFLLFSARSLLFHFSVARFASTQRARASTISSCLAVVVVLAANASQRLGVRIRLQVDYFYVITTAIVHYG